MFSKNKPSEYTEEYIDSDTERCIHDLRSNPELLQSYLDDPLQKAILGISPLKSIPEGVFFNSAILAGEKFKLEQGLIPDPDYVPPSPTKIRVFPLACIFIGIIIPAFVTIVLLTKPPNSMIPEQAQQVKELSVEKKPNPIIMI